MAAATHPRARRRVRELKWWQWFSPDRVAGTRLAIPSPSVHGRGLVAFSGRHHFGSHRSSPSLPASFFPPARPLASTASSARQNILAKTRLLRSASPAAPAGGAHSLPRICHCEPAVGRRSNPGADTKAHRAEAAELTRNVPMMESPPEKRQFASQRKVPRALSEFREELSGLLNGFSSRLPWDFVNEVPV